MNFGDDPEYIRPIKPWRQYLQLKTPRIKQQALNMKMQYKQINLNTGYNLLTVTKNTCLKAQRTVVKTLTFRRCS